MKHRQQKSLQSGLPWAAALTAAVSVLTTPVPTIAVAANLLVNPGFDDAGGSYVGWLTFGNAFVDVGVETPPLSGVASSKMFGNFSGGFNVTGIFQAFPASSGQRYQIDVFSRHRSGDELTGLGPPDSNWVVQKIVFFDAPAGGSEIGSGESFILTGASPRDVWIDNLPLQAVAPVGTQRVEAFFLYLQPQLAGGASFLDDARFELIPEPASISLVGLALIITACSRCVGRRVA
jgi:hypothetical protein